MIKLLISIILLYTYVQAEISPKKKEVKAFWDKKVGYLQAEKEQALQEKYPLCDKFVDREKLRKAANHGKSGPIGSLTMERDTSTVCVEEPDGQYARILAFKKMDTRYDGIISDIVMPYYLKENDPKLVNIPAQNLKRRNSFFAYDVNHDGRVDFLEDARPNIFYSYGDKGEYKLSKYLNERRMYGYMELWFSKNHYYRFHQLDKKGKFIGMIDYYYTDGKDLYYREFNDRCNLSIAINKENQKGK